MPRRLAVNLTDSAVKKAPLPVGKARLYLWDSQVPGYFVRLGSDGRGKHGVVYRDALNRQRWLTLPGGHWPAVTVTVGRDAARRVLSRIAEGKDPAAERDRARAGETVGEAWKAYLDAMGPHWRPSTRRMKEWVWGATLEPRFARTRLEAVTPAAVGKMHRDVAERGKTLANHAVVTLKALYGWLIREEILPGPNPCTRTKAFKTPPRERFLGLDETRILLEAIGIEEELGGVAAVKRDGEAVKGHRGGKGLKESESRGIAPSAATLFRVLAYTGCRKGEIMLARWEWVDWERARLVLPEDASKSGARSVPLSGAALEELHKAWNRRANNEWIVEGRDPSQPLTNAQKPWVRVLDRANALVNQERERAGLEPLDPGPFAGLRIHDLRHSWVSAAVELGVPLFVAGKAVGHRNERTSARYAHLSDNPLAQAHETVAARIAAAIAGQGAKVEEITPATAPLPVAPAELKAAKGGAE